MIKKILLFCGFTCLINLQIHAMIPDKSFFIAKWEAYLQAFTKADYTTLGTQFHYPVSLLLENPMLLKDEASFVETIKFIREKKLQPGYAYSKTDSAKLTILSESSCYLDVVYSRYNANHERIYQGRGLYFFKKFNDDWKIQVNMPIQ
ncbi:MAG: hypothetical protein ACKOXH_10820 [Aquirufa sp.]